MPQGPNVLGESETPLFFKVSNPGEVGTRPPPNRKGDSLQTWVRSLSLFQKEAIVASSRTGDVWRLASDEGPYLDGHDAAPCPLAFLTAGMIASYMNEITALGRLRNVAIRRLRLVQDNYWCVPPESPVWWFIEGDDWTDELRALLAQCLARMTYFGRAETLTRPDAFNVLLSHNPDVFPVAARKGFPLTIAGHTHGGQIRFEILRQDLSIVRFITPYYDGLYRENGSSIFVSRGIGTIALPARLGAPPEVALLRLCRT